MGILTSIIPGCLSEYGIKDTVSIHVDWLLSLRSLFANKMDVIFCVWIRKPYEMDEENLLLYILETLVQDKWLKSR